MLSVSINIIFLSSPVASTSKTARVKKTMDMIDWTKVFTRTSYSPMPPLSKPFEGDQ